MATISRPIGDSLVRARPATGLWRDAFGRLRKNRLAILGLVLVMLLAFFGIFGPVIAPWPYQVQDLPAVFAAGGGPLPPGSPTHLLGTDNLGRDLLSRLLDGARISVSVALVVQFVILVIGVAIGVSDRRIVTRHLLPNGISPIIVAITLGIPGAILAEATLAYIGIGVQPPRASWGSLIAEGQKYVRSEPHLVMFPAIAIALALIGFTFLGDGLRDALDPKLKGKQ